MSLPNATQQQMNAMMAAAEKQFGKEPAVEAAPVIHPTLQHHEEPVEQVEQIVAEPEQVIEVVEEVDIDDQPRIETNKEYNMRMLREAKEKAERERDDLMRQFSMMQQQNTIPKKEVAPIVEEDYLAEMGLDEDSLVEGKHFKAYLKKQKDLERQLQQYKNQSTQETVEVRLKHQYPDFDTVVSADNLTALRTADPDLAEMIMNTSDLYKQASLAYRMVKQYGIHKTVDPRVESDKAAVLKNAAKPRPMAAVSPQQGTTPLSQANAFANQGVLTKEMQSQLLKEMRQSQKGY